MTFQDVLARLERFPIPPNFTDKLFQQETWIMEAFYDFVLETKSRDVLELGTGYGATACVVSAAVEELGGGRVVTVDRELFPSVNVASLKTHLGFTANPEVVADPQGYSWYLKDLIKQQSQGDRCDPLFDLCYLDGAHDWDTDALAFFLAAKLIRPGGWIVMDDIAFRFIDIPEEKRRRLFPNLAERQLWEFQVGTIWNLCVRQHPDFGDFRITDDGRLGWARKRLAVPDNPT